MKATASCRLLGLFLCGFALPSAAAKPDAAPKIIELIVPYAPGGASDTVGRAIAPALQEATGSQVVVVNKPGANGAIAGSYLARAEKDGSKILLADVAIVLNPILQSNAPYDVKKDFAAVALVGTGPFVLYVPGSGPGDLKSFLKSGERGRTVAHSGVGSLGHLAAELLQQKTGSKLLSVAYQGAGPAMADTVGGQVDALFGSTASGMGMVRTHRLKALAVADSKRLPTYPDIPTFEELGVEGVRVINWWGLVAPSGTPADVVSWLYDGVRRVLADAGIKKKLTGIEVTPTLMDTARYNTLIDQDIALWESVVKRADISLN